MAVTIRPAEEGFLFPPAFQVRPKGGRRSVQLRQRQADRPVRFAKIPQPRSYQARKCHRAGIAQMSIVNQTVWVGWVSFCRQYHVQFPASHLTQCLHQLAAGGRQVDAGQGRPCRCAIAQAASG